jgi:aryl-alcohol dehydrogenase-like predicted oxidoreductase
MQLQHVKLGATDLLVSEIGLGAWAIGSKGYGLVEEKHGIETVEAYLNAGGNFIDTAPVYGCSEALLGKIIKDLKCRDRIVLATKTKMGDTLETVSKIKGACEDSLKLLRTEYIDVYYLHTPPEDTETIKRALDEFEELKRQGKIRVIGASVKAAAVTKKTVDLANTYIETGRVEVLQLAYSIIRQANEKVFKKAHSNGVGIVARTAIESGFLSGKYRPGHVFKSDHRLRWSKETLIEIFELANKIAEHAIKPPYSSLTQVAIRFSLAPDEVSSLLVGARDATQLQDNLNTLALPPLDKKIIDRIKKELSEMTEKFNPTQQGWIH